MHMYKKVLLMVLLGPSDPFWFGELYFLFAFYWFGNYCGTKLWEAHKIPVEVLEEIKSVSSSNSPSQDTEFAGTLAVAKENLDTWLPHKQAQEQARN